MDVLDDMGVSKLSAKVFLKVNSSFNSVLKTIISIMERVFLNHFSSSNAF